MIPENARETLENTLFEAGNVLLSLWGTSHKAKVKESISSVDKELYLAEHLIAYSFDFSTDPAKTASEMQLMARLTKQVRNIIETL